MRNFEKRGALREALRLYAVTDRRWLGERTLKEACAEALAGGVTALQLREKQESADGLSRAKADILAQEAKELMPLCRAKGVPLILDDDVETALAVGADGVHLGQEDLKRLGGVNEAGLRNRLGLPESFILGISAHTVAEAQAAERAGADYLGVGAVFATGTKADAHSMARETLKSICEAVSIPVVAIGGLTEENIPQLSGVPLSGFALVSAIFAQADVRQAARRLAAATRTVLTPPVLSVAGSDSSGGAGIQADLKTMTSLGCYGMTAVAALTAQNTTGVRASLAVKPDFLAAQLDAVFEDIPPLAVKTGMLATAALTQALAERLQAHRAQNVVADPVMVATSGAALAEDAAVAAMKDSLFPLARVITPNIPEAERLTGLAIKNRAEMEQAARLLGEECGCAVLVKGGHALADADDVLYEQGKITWLHGERIITSNTHGTGCTLSSAIACFLARGFSLSAAVCQAKAYLSAALAEGFDIGQGSGPLYHLVKM